MSMRCLVEFLVGEANTINTLLRANATVPNKLEEIEAQVIEAQTQRGPNIEAQSEDSSSTTLIHTQPTYPFKTNFCCIVCIFKIKFLNHF